MSRTPHELVIAHRCYAQGDHEGALQLCGQALERDTACIPALQLAAQIHVQQSQYRRALELFRTWCSLEPENEHAHLSVGVACERLGEHEAAERAYRAGTRINPKAHLLHFNLGNCLLSQGRLGDALEAYRRAVGLDPDNAEYLNNLGLALREAGSLEQALRSFQEAATVDPRYALAHANLGFTCDLLGDTDASVRHYREAVSLDPENTEVRLCLAQSLYARKAYEEVVRTCRQALSFPPTDERMPATLGNALFQLGDFEAALSAFEQAIGLNPARHDIHNFIANIHYRQGDFENAIASAETALRLKPFYEKGLSDLIEYALAAGDPDLAHATAVRGLDCVFQGTMNLDLLLHALIRAFRETADWERCEALKAHIREIRDPSRLTNPQAVLLHLHYDNPLGPDRLSSWHRAWAASVEKEERSESPRVHARASRGNRVRIGYVSPDFRRHSVGYFIRNILRAHDRSRFEVLCYANRRPDPSDPVTREIMEHSEGFREIHALADDEAAERISRDGVDILVDLAGHTRGNRLGLFARRAAPVQITYLGYPDTTGLSTMDYRITDRHADPEGHGLCSEKLLFMPECFLHFGTFPHQDIDATCAFEKNGHVTFGSLNSLNKITPRAVRAWAGVLHSVENARLLIKSYSPMTRRIVQRILAEFSKHGIPEHRLSIAGATASAVDHFRFYNEVDIALDTFPYNGTTITCESLWMGVPVVTLVGGLHCQRTSYTILRNLELDALVAGSEEAYVGIAAALAQDLFELRALKQALPDRLGDSILCDTPRFTRQLEACYTRALANA